MARAGKQINLNTADFEELADLPNVGEERAQDILEYREENGPFENWDDLLHVPGFSQRLVENLKQSGVTI